MNASAARVTQGGHWTLSGQPKDLTFRSRVYPALAGAREATSDQLALLDLNTRPADKMTRQVLAGCARMVADSSLTTEAGKKDYAALVLALQGLSPQAAKQVEEAGRLARDNIFKPKEKEIKAVVARLEEADASDAEMLRGLIDEFWTLLKQCGDPIADLALDLNKGEGFGAGFAALLIKTQLGDLYIRKVNPPNLTNSNVFFARSRKIKIPHDSWKKAQQRWVECQFRQIQREIALMHWEFIQKDEKGRKGLLDPEQITRYHHDVFQRHGLPRGAFGGTAITGDLNSSLSKLFLKLGFWCDECDKIFEEE